MAWALLVVLAGLIVGLAFVNFGYRRSLPVVLVLLLVGLAGVIWYTQVQDRVSEGKIPPDQIRLDNFTMRQAYGDSYKLVARVVNGSPEHTLQSFGLTVTVSDCTGSPQRRCVIVGERAKDIYVEVPPQQARDISEQFVYGAVRPQGELSWDYRVTHTEAR